MSTRPKGTESFEFNHAMIRIKDPKRSLKWYQDVLGMTLINESPSKEAKFCNYFVRKTKSYLCPGETAEQAKAAQGSRKNGIIELCHNWGTEDDPKQKYHNGNESTKMSDGSALVCDKADIQARFGHMCISVDNLQTACQRFTELGVDFQKRPEDGRMRHIAFIKDPDAYWWEIIENKPRA